MWGPGGRMEQAMRSDRSPEYTVISCIDPRCKTGVIFNAAPGDFFPFTSPGAIVRPYQRGTNLAATLDLSFRNGVTKLVLMGHTGCKAVTQLVEGNDGSEAGSFVEVAKEAFEAACARVNVNLEEDLLRETERQVVKLSLGNLLEYPSVRYAISAGRLIVEAWMYDMHAGNLLRLNNETGLFEPLTHFVAGELHEHKPEPV